MADRELGEEVRRIAIATRGPRTDDSTSLDTTRRELGKAVKNYAVIVYGSSESNLLRLPFFRNGKDPLEDFDYSGPRCNPIRQPSSCKNS
ncbi:hypothetical protein F511_33300 [Dorcoceras hygrometricum]|uniref:Uncharacterized protein n=1 Tax=Dorcoceras hygrometricum TaxID=472368 RepID=A0A2Z7C4L8_9LAMI|nr:hypothetical protein F511_33300 [Dorcoceras hygrometricum]